MRQPRVGGLLRLITIAVGRLRGQRRRSSELRRGEVEKLHHVVGVGIACGQRLQVEAGLDEF
jgi:hypothetical protein